MPNSAASRLVLAPYAEELVKACAQELLREVGGTVSCALVFVSSDYQPFLEDFLELVQVHGHVPVIAGCSGAGLIGTAQEAEDTTGFSVLFLHLPETKLHSFALSSEELADLAGPDAWHRATGAKPADVSAWVVLGNPAVLPVEDWLEEWNAAYPGVPCLGGLSSAAPDQEFFLYQDHHLVESAVALGFRGGCHLETIVSQGCRPVGEPFTITAADENIVVSLASRPAYERLSETFEALPASDKAQAVGNLFAGLAMTEYVDEFRTGDFLIRNLIGADPNSGALAIGAQPRVGQTLQFQLRDRRSANDDLQRMLLEKARAGVKPFASLVFSCNGRGQQLFGVADHDARAVAEHLGTVPSAGFFCNGEIGPVGGHNHIHGYTASIALFTDVRP
jgi:small ligand-binding sensory domain FIST